MIQSVDEYSESEFDVILKQTASTTNATAAVTSAQRCDAVTMAMAAGITQGCEVVQRKYIACDEWS